jgi:WG containing repeat
MIRIKTLQILTVLLLVITGYVSPTEVVTIFPQKPYDSDPTIYPIFSRWNDGQTYIGYIDSAGQVVIPVSIPAGKSKHIWGRDFYEGLLAVSIKVDDRWLRGFIDKSGEIAIAPKFKSAIRFSEGLAAVRDEKTDKYGYIDKKGSYVIEPKLDVDYSMGDFHNGRARFMKGDLFKEGILYGYIDLQGNKIIPARFYEAEDFSEGVAWVNDGSTCWNVQDFEFRLKGQSMDKRALMADFAEGKIPHCRYWLINKSGEIISKRSYRDTKAAWGGFAAGDIAETEDLRDTPHGVWQYLNTRGEVVISPDPEYSFKQRFHEGLAIEREEGKWRYINSIGEMVFEADFDRCGNFVGELALVQLKKDEGFTKQDYINGSIEYSQIRPIRYAYINHSGEIVFAFTENSLVPEPRNDIRQ